MPYKASGTWVYVKRKGVWVRHKKCSTEEQAQKTATALNINVARKENSR